MPIKQMEQTTTIWPEGSKRHYPNERWDLNEGDWGRTLFLNTVVMVVMDDFE